VLGVEALFWLNEESAAATLLAEAEANSKASDPGALVAAVKQARATLELSRGRLVEAEAAAREAVTLTRSTPPVTAPAPSATTLPTVAPSSIADSIDLVVRVLLAAGRVSEARAALGEEGPPGGPLRRQSTRAAVLLADGKAADAVALLQLAVGGIAPLPESLEARLVLGQAETVARKLGPGTGKARIQAALAEARARGLRALTKPLGWLKAN
jgi:hypothetical protein